MVEPRGRLKMESQTWDKTSSEVVGRFGLLIRGLTKRCHGSPVLSLPKGKVKHLLNRLPMHIVTEEIQIPRRALP